MTPSSRTLTLALALALAPAPACRRAPLRVTDTEGRVFELRCEGEGCEVRPLNAVSDPVGGRTSPNARAGFDVVIRGRYAAVCDAWIDPQRGSVAAVSTCRAIACERDEQCPALPLVRGVRCARGLCGVPERPIDATDVALLCLAGTGVWRETPAQQSRLALGRTCSPPCDVPPACRRP